MLIKVLTIARFRWGSAASSFIPEPPRCGSRLSLPLSRCCREGEHTSLIGHLSPGFFLASGGHVSLFREVNGALLGWAPRSLASCKTAGKELRRTSSHGSDTSCRGVNKVINSFMPFWFGDRFHMLCKTERFKWETIAFCPIVLWQPMAERGHGPPSVMERMPLTHSNSLKLQEIMWLFVRSGFEWPLCAPLQWHTGGFLLSWWEEISRPSKGDFAY